MIDLKRLRDEAEYREGIERKRIAPGLLDELLTAVEQRHALSRDVETLRARQNAASKEISKATPDERPSKIAAATALKEQLGAMDPTLDTLDARVRELALTVPNPAHRTVPTGGEDDFEIIATVGEINAAPPMDHAMFGEAMGFVDTERAASVSGARFAYLMREAVLLELALVQWVVSKLRGEGFTPVIPPVLVREQAMVEAGFFPTDRAQVYDLDDDELFLVGTSEVPLAGLHRDEILDANDLPLRYAGISPCFRREAGTYGKDTRGLFRVHQFDKVEMFSYCDPDASWDELEAIRSLQESIVSDLGLPYRVINVAAGDLGNPAAKKYDVEVWLPSEGKYRELMSCSNYTDYSARRLATRVRGDDGNTLAHTLNGTACAVGRTLLNIFEHYQQGDGSLVVPEVLRPFAGFDRVEAK